MTINKTFKSILVIVIGFMILAEVFELKYLYYGALAVGVLSLLSDEIAQKIEWLWFKLAEGMGWVMSKVILSLVYYVILLPLATAQRTLSRNDPLQLKKPNNKSTLVDRNHVFKKEDLENIW